MDQQPIWKVSFPDALDRNCVEELLSRTAVWQEGGTGLQMERIDSAEGATSVFLSGSEADSRSLVSRIGKRYPKWASGLECVPCTMKELHKMEEPVKKGRSSKR